ncbi:class I SAM-dependent methyltransferase [Legionella pneumophila serogroup 1]|uniref:class I SAM-dependent methyltransferase n=1 Tax=Legionella pneumophila TaxID=446 RepID=UPI000494832E|nr:class I SAM-dependent methyltransferase [Legionella pneumophila]HAT8829878.1 methyltransferase [Legionella pneumophila subsp. pneumophila]MCZ4678742.1 class I SAM-dependent methyltransferase [Legionella pneumophila]MCZ4703510.1 class I SAM-dependent methyltransferase [Legionella pneumophila]MCZ4738873.1 class I SAM-dependent methyltransferase [Legionella pneumophila]MCZ4750515.1 class I SAM-dependent methyltransferase [Legionella pneumophila]
MDNTNSKQHWDGIYTDKSPESVSWFQKEPTLSIKLIQNFGGHQPRIIDVGGGTSSLVDHLLNLGYSQVAVLDISDRAIEYVKKRLADRATQVEWYVNDITRFTPGHAYDIWHDRAVFHFLNEEKSRKAYLNVLRNTIKPRGYVIIASFAKDGPKKCSGLDIVQYDAESIQKEFGDEFILLESQLEEHVTPAGNEQQFIYFIFQRQ